MPPRSKQKLKDLVLCECCGCSFVLSFLNEHAKICQKSSPYHFPNVLQETSRLFDDVPHPLLHEDASLCCIQVLKDVPDHIPNHLKDRCIQLSPHLMKSCHLRFGQPVMLNKTCVLPAWPNKFLPFTSVGVTSACLKVAGVPSSSQFLMLEDFHGPVFDATIVHVKLLTNTTHKDPESLTNYARRVSVGYHIRNSSFLSFLYYGQPCEMEVSSINGHETIGTRIENSFEQVNQISQEVRDLHLSLEDDSITDSSLDMTSTPLKHVKPKQKDFCSNTSQFYSISNSTKIVLDDNKHEEKGPKRNCGLHLFGGYNKQITHIKDMLSSHLFQSHLFNDHGFSSPQGVLLYGPSGVGKTHLVHCLVTEYPAYFLPINGAEVWSKFYGESEAKLVALFQEAKERSPCIIFLDEVDALCPKRDRTKNDTERRVVVTLLNQLDSLTGRDQVFVLAATNCRENIDPALRRPGRLDREVELTTPPPVERHEILTKLLSGQPHSISPSVIQNVADKTHGFLGADLLAVCKEAMMHALKTTAGESSATVCLTTEDLTYALPRVKPSAMKEVTLEVSQVSWSDIGGQEDLKLKLKQAVEWPLKHPEAFTRLGIRPPRGLLMYGPPGCSKTMIAKALAKESGLNFIAIKGPELFSKWVGESERAVREVFRRARAATPSVVFFDEIDALAGERGSQGGGGDVSDRVLAQLLTEMDGVEALEDILVVAATNRPDRIDKALMRPGRLDRIVYVPLPDNDTRKAIFNIHFQKMPTASDVRLDDLVAGTLNYSGAEVAAVCHEAALAAMQEDINTPDVSMRHFDQALALVTPRITPDLMQIYAKYQEIS